MSEQRLTTAAMKAAELDMPHREEVTAAFREIGRLANAIAEERKATLSAFGRAVQKNLQDAAKRRSQP